MLGYYNYFRVFTTRILVLKETGLFSFFEIARFSILPGFYINTRLTSKSYLPRITKFKLLIEPSIKEMDLSDKKQ